MTNFCYACNHHDHESNLIYDDGCWYCSMCHVEKNSIVENPIHYKSKKGLQAIDVIENFGLGFNLGNVIKYVLRCEKKHNKKQDLQKALWYLKRELDNAELDK